MNKLYNAYQATRHQLVTHKLFVMVFGAVTISLVLVSIALMVYTRSDAARLDLSHPDYKPLRSQITVDKWRGYSAAGPINEEALDDFQKKFDEQAARATGVDAFSGDVLNDQMLGIEE